MEGLEAQYAAERLLQWFLKSFHQRIHCCGGSSVLTRLDAALAGPGDGIEKGDFCHPVSAGTFTRLQVPSLLEHFGAESTQGVLLLCIADSASAECAYTLWFQNGALIHAEGQGSIGRAALKASCQCQGGLYLYVEVPIPADLPASLPEGRGVTFLLLDILRQIDEESQGTVEPPQREQPQPSTIPAVRLDPAQFAKLVRLVEAVREGLLMQQRAELDAWYYRQGAEKVARSTELERRALGRLYQWMAANSLMATVNELQDLPSIKARCELLAELLDQFSANLNETGSADAGLADSDGDDVDWSILEDDEGLM